MNATFEQVHSYAFGVSKSLLVLADVHIATETAH